MFCSYNIYRSHINGSHHETIHAHGNDLRLVERKQNCAFSEKWAMLVADCVSHQLCQWPYLLQIYGWIYSVLVSHFTSYLYQFVEKSFSLTTQLFMAVSHQVNTFYQWNDGWHWEVHIYGVYFWLGSSWKY